jgi:hypothetical protein
MAYGLVAITCASLGYWLTPRPSSVSEIYLVRVPTRPADRECFDSNFHTEKDAQRTIRNVVLIRERTVEDKPNIVYWCPQRPGTWGEVEIEWRWEPSFEPDLAILETNVSVATVFDPTAVAEFAIASNVTNQQWHTLLRLDASSPDQAFIESIDVSRWVQNCTSIRIRYRMLANKLMYHPTPNDPIGLAGAQCSRQSMGSRHASRLRFWKHESDSVSQVQD